MVHERLAFGRDRTHFVDLADGVDGILHLLGDLGFDLFGRGAGIGDGDLYSGDIDLGEEVDTEAEVREDADDHERENQHRGEDGALDTELVRVRALVFTSLRQLRLCSK